MKGLSLQGSLPVNLSGLVAEKYNRDMEHPKDSRSYWLGDQVGQAGQVVLEGLVDSSAKIGRAHV